MLAHNTGLYGELTIAFLIYHQICTFVFMCPYRHKIVTAVTAVRQQLTGVNFKSELEHPQSNDTRRTQLTGVNFKSDRTSSK